MELPQSVTELLTPDTTRLVSVLCFPTKRKGEIAIKVDPTRVRQVTVGRVLGVQRDEMLADIRRQLETRKYMLDQVRSSRDKLIFRYQEDPT